MYFNILHLLSDYHIYILTQDSSECANFYN